MNTQLIRAKLINALTAHDERQSHRKGHNPYALAQYIQRVDQVCADIGNGTSVRVAILKGFSGKLADLCLRAVSEPMAERQELMGTPIYYG